METNLIGELIIHDGNMYFIRGVLPDGILIVQALEGDTLLRFNLDMVTVGTPKENLPMKALDTLCGGDILRKVLDAFYGPSFAQAIYETCSPAALLMTMLELKTEATNALHS